MSLNVIIELSFFIVSVLLLGVIIIYKNNIFHLFLPFIQSELLIKLVEIIFYKFGIIPSLGFHKCENFFGLIFLFRKLIAIRYKLFDSK